VVALTGVRVADSYEKVFLGLVQSVELVMAWWWSPQQEIVWSTASLALLRFNDMQYLAKFLLLSLLSLPRYACKTSHLMLRARSLTSKACL
jgi:hypothetical protein